jgi:hypothetical protein
MKSQLRQFSSPGFAGILMGKDSDNNLPVNIKKNHDTFGFVVASHSGFWPGCGGTEFRLVEEILNSIPSVLGYSRVANPAFPPDSSV